MRSTMTGILLGALACSISCGEPSNQNPMAGPSAATGGGSGSPVDAASDGQGQAGAGGSSAGVDAAGDASSKDGGGSNQECLPDGSGRLVLTTQGGLVVDLQKGNDLYCAGAGFLNRSSGYDLVLSDIPLSGGDTRLTTTVRVPNGMTSKTGPEDVVVTIMTYSDPLLSEAKYWRGNCAADVTTNMQVASNSVFLTYKVAATVSCAAPLASRAADGGSSGDAPVQITRFETVTSVAWGFD